MGVKLAQTNFSSGELDPLMDMRHDTGAYQNGARKLRNIALLNQGGGTRRPGTEHLNTLTGRSRLIPFEFSSSERYIFALSNTQLKVFSTSGTLLQTLTAPWTTAMLFELTFTQAADVMVICYPTMKTQIIRRTAADTFTIADFAFDSSINSNKVYQPYYKYAADTVTLSASGTTGSVTLTTSASYFVAGHVGMRPSRTARLPRAPLKARLKALMISIRSRRNTPVRRSSSPMWRTVLPPGNRSRFRGRTTLVVSATTRSTGLERSP